MLNYHTFPGFELLNLGFTYQFLFHYLNWELNPYEDGMGQWRSIFFTYQFGGKISVYLYYNFLFLVISSPFSPISSSPNIKSTVYIKKHTVRIPVKSYIESERQGYTKTSFICTIPSSEVTW